MSAQLIVVAGPDTGKAFPVKAGESLLLGRSPNSGARLTDPTVSRVHCEVKVVDGQALLLDHVGGTHVNGHPVDRHEMQPDDVIAIGKTQLRFDSPDEEEEQAPADVARPPSLPAERMGELTGYALGRYRVGTLLGEGRTGLVFQGRDGRHDRVIALKVLWPELSRDAQEVRRFVRAMRTMLPIRHPHLVQILGAGLTQPYCWVALELVEGKSLGEVIERGTPLPWRQALRVATHVSRALVFAHHHHIVHRNISPHSILVRAADQVAKLGGALMAKALEGRQVVEVTRRGELVGQAGYMAPEQTTGISADLDHRADLYSLGATLYALLTGQPPIKARSVIEALLKVRQEKPVSTRRHQPEVPEALDTLVLKLLAKAREDRYQTAGELLGELTRFAKAVGEKP
jgi:serine/threonine protein kinase